MLESVLDMLSGRYPSDEFAELRPRVTWDRLAGTLRPREGARRVAITNSGTIPDRGLYGVFLAGAERGQGRVGELDEEMVFESRVGETFLLGASSWRIEEITHDRVIVSPAPGEPGKMPFWKGGTFTDIPKERGGAAAGWTAVSGITEGGREGGTATRPTNRRMAGDHRGSPFSGGGGLSGATWRRGAFRAGGRAWGIPGGRRHPSARSGR
jgi:hypothetical protein